jgi:hypothetical protein
MIIEKQNVTRNVKWGNIFLSSGWGWGWMDGWIHGSKCGSMDCLQQYKIRFEKSEKGHLQRELVLIASYSVSAVHSDGNLNHFLIK